jgi:hypothetical protein
VCPHLGRLVRHLVWAARPRRVRRVRRAVTRVGGAGARPRGGRPARSAPPPPNSLADFLHHSPHRRLIPFEGAVLASRRDREQFYPWPGTGTNAEQPAVRE